MSNKLLLQCFDAQNSKFLFRQLSRTADKSHNSVTKFGEFNYTNAASAAAGSPLMFFFKLALRGGGNRIKFIAAHLRFFGQNFAKQKITVRRRGGELVIFLSLVRCLGMRSTR